MHPCMWCLSVWAPARAPVLRTAGQRLARVLERCRSRDGQRPLLLVSSDMNHYEDQQTTLRKDDLALDAALKGDADALLATVAREGISMCGAAPLALAFYALHAWAPDAAVRRNPGHARNVRRCFARSRDASWATPELRIFKLLKGPSKKQAKELGIPCPKPASSDCYVDTIFRPWYIHITYVVWHNPTAVFFHYANMRRHAMSLNRRDFVKLCTGTVAGFGVAQMFHPAVRESPGRHVDWRAPPCHLAAGTGLYPVVQCRC